MKRLYDFSINKEVETEETTANEDGSKTIKTVKKEVPQKFFLQRPNRLVRDEGELFYAVALSECIKAGCLTQIQLSKRYVNDSGTMSEDEKKEYTELYGQLLKLEEEYQRLNLKKPEEFTPEENERYQKIFTDLAEISEKIQKLEYVHSALFDQTAENIARNKVVRWWITMLAYKENGDKIEPVFGEGDYNKKLEKYMELEESGEPFYNELFKRLLYFVTFWVVGRADKPEDFERLGKVF